MTTCGLWSAILAAGDDPPRKLTAAERAALIRKLQEFNAAEVEHREAGEFAKATTASREALAIARQLYPKELFPNGHVDLAVCLNNLGTTLREHGKLTQAEPFLREALEMHRRLAPGDHRHIASTLNNLGTLLHEQGKFAEAETMLRESLEMSRRLIKGDSPELALRMNNLASLLHTQGKLADAEKLHREALEMRRRLFKGDHPDLAMSLGNLGGVLSAKGEYAAAEQLFRDALKMNQRLAMGDHPAVVLMLNNLGDILVIQGKLADAESHFREALAGARRMLPPDHPVLAALLSNLADVLHASGKYSEARKLCRESLAAYRRLLAFEALGATEGEILLRQAWTPTTRSQLLSLDRDAKTPTAEVYPEVWASKAAISRFFEQRHQAARAVADPRAAKWLKELAAARRQREEVLLSPNDDDPLAIKQREHLLRTLDQRISALEREIRPLLPVVARAEKLDRATPADLQKQLPPDAALVDYLQYSHYQFDNSKPAGQKPQATAAYTAFVVTRDKLAWVDLGPADGIEAAVTAWREAITGGKEIPAAVPAKVRELIWENVRKELPAGVRTVYIAPDLALCRVPWGALPGDKPGTILLEDFAVAAVPHAPFLLDQLWPPDPVANPPTGLLAVGNVDYDAEPVGAAATREIPLKPGTRLLWQKLPGAAAEAAGVETLAKNHLAVTSLRGEKATPAAVLAALPRVSHAHLATHGFFADASFRSAFRGEPRGNGNRTRPELSAAEVLSPLVMTGLVFAGANNSKTSGRGIVTGEALIDLDLSGLKLAVLSACETGLGSLADGEGTFGLQRAFHLAGTRNVVASLWKVPDTPTAALMAEFYRNLWEKNQPPLAALREAQLFIYRNPGKIAELAAGFRAGFKEVAGSEPAIAATAAGKTHPQLWAGFMLSGVGR